MEIFEVSSVQGSTASEDGSHIVLLAMINDEKGIIRLPLSAATGMQVALQDAAADAAIKGGSSIVPPIAEGLLLQASHVHGQDILTVRLDSGMQLQFLVPQGRYDNGVRRMPDSQHPSEGHN